MKTFSKFLETLAVPSADPLGRSNIDKELKYAWESIGNATRKLRQVAVELKSKPLIEDIDKITQNFSNVIQQMYDIQQDWPD